MKIFIYDHLVENVPAANYFVSICYRDDSRKSEVNYICLEDSLCRDEQFFQATSDLYEFSNLEKDGKTIKDLVSFDGISLWWFYETFIRKSYAEYLIYKYSFENFMKEKDILEVEADLNSGTLLRIVRDYCSKKDIKFIDKGIAGKSRNNYWYYASYLLQYLVMIVISKIYSSHVSAPVLLASYTRYWTRFNVTNNLKQDGIFHQLQEEFSIRNIAHIGIEQWDDSLRGFIKTRLEKRKYDESTWIPLAAYIDLGIIRRSLSAYKNVNHDLSLFIPSEENQRFVLDILKRNIRESLFDIIEINCFRKALETVKPKVILISCEYCIFGRMAVILGNRKGISTVALQHGTITDTSSEFIFANKDITSFSGDPGFRPIPRITAVFGKAYRDILINKSTYPPESVVITGPPRYDILANADKIYSRDAFFKKMGFDLNKELVFCTTDGLPESRASANAYGMLEALLEMGDKVQLLIKPHPNNIDRPLYEMAAKELGVNAIITGDLNLYEAIFASDVLITWFSTTALEAIMLGRPTVILNLTSEPDYVNYIKEGVAFGAHSKEELIVVLDKIFRGERCPADNKKAFIEKYVYRLDGKATNRVADIVTNCIGMEH